MIAEDVASAPTLSLICSETEAGAVFAAGGAHGRGLLAVAFLQERRVFVFPDEPSPIRLEAIRYACRRAGTTRPHDPDDAGRRWPGECALCGGAPLLGRSPSGSGRTCCCVPTCARADAASAGVGEP